MKSEITISAAELDKVFRVVRERRQQRLHNVKFLSIHDVQSKLVGYLLIFLESLTAKVRKVHLQASLARGEVVTSQPPGVYQFTKGFVCLHMGDGTVTHMRETATLKDLLQFATPEMGDQPHSSFQTSGNPAL